MTYLIIDTTTGSEISEHTLANKAAEQFDEIVEAELEVAS